ncbi:MAG TPA: hypothetical protein VIL71_02400 [Spirillospora sp.]
MSAIAMRPVVDTEFEQVRPGTAHRGIVENSEFEMIGCLNLVWYGRH